MQTHTSNGIKQNATQWAVQAIVKTAQTGHKAALAQQALPDINKVIVETENRHALAQRFRDLGRGTK